MFTIFDFVAAAHLKKDKTSQTLRDCFLIVIGHQIKKIMNHVHQIMQNII